MPQITTKIDGPLGWLVIDAPDTHNAMTQEMWRQVPLALESLSQNPDVRVIMVRGAGERAFSAGADISEFDQLRHGDNAAAYNQLNNDAFDALQNCPKPTLSMIHGHCLGGGFLLALATDLRIAGNGAKFSLPPAKLGLGFDMAWLQLVVKAMPAALAKEMFFTAGSYSSDQLHSFGALSQVVDDTSLEEQTIALARTIAANAPLTLETIKKGIEALEARDHHIDLAVHEAFSQRCFESEDYAEGRAAFKERRKPVFKGR